MSDPNANLIKTPEMIPTNGLEVSVRWTANRLGVSERSVLNYIKAGTLRAQKIRRDWLIDRASVDALAATYGFPANQVPVPTEIAVPQIPEPHDSRTKSRSEQAPIHTLHSFRVALTCFSSARWSTLSETDSLSKQLQKLRLDFFSEIGAGYYCSGREKIDHYSKARGSVGGILSLLQCSKDTEAQWNSEIGSLSSDLMPALGALIGSIKSKSYGNRPYGDFRNGGGNNKGRRWGNRED